MKALLVVFLICIITLCGAATTLTILSGLSPEILLAYTPRWLLRVGIDRTLMTLSGQIEANDIQRIDQEISRSRSKLIVKSRAPLIAGYDYPSKIEFPQKPGVTLIVSNRGSVNYVIGLYSREGDADLHNDLKSAVLDLFRSLNMQVDMAPYQYKNIY